jgi:hypothetical protein
MPILDKPGGFWRELVREAASPDMWLSLATVAALILLIFAICAGRS